MDNTASETTIKRKAIVQSAFIVAIVIILITLGLSFTIKEIEKYKENALNCYKVGQEKLVEHVEKEIYSALLQGNANLQEILEKADTSGSRHWFLYSPEKIHFEKNREETQNNKDLTFKQLMDRWKIAGGEGIVEFYEKVYEKENGSLVFTKDAKEGAGLVSLRNFTYEGEDYHLGVFTKFAYILQQSNADSRIVALRIFAAVTGLSIITLSTFLILMIIKRNREVLGLNTDMEERNRQIQELIEQLQSKTDKVESISIYDVTTGIYNKSFFEGLLNRVEYEKLKPVCYMIIDINGFEKFCQQVGYGAGNELLKRTSTLLEKFCIGSDIIARTGNSEFSILMTNADEEQANGTMENILRQFSNIDNRGLTLSIGVAQMPDEAEHIQPTSNRARKYLMLSKMLDETSDSSSTITMLMETLGAFSKNSVEQSKRLRELAQIFGKDLGLSPSELSRLEVAAQLHDVGKIGIPNSILDKKTPLTPQEMNLIKRHPEIGYNILKAIPYLDEVALDVLKHQEFYNGEGYPLGLKERQISLNARIINILDSYDAMTHERPYARAMTPEEALEELMKGRGKQYDSYLVERFVRLITEKLDRDRRKSL